MPKKDISSEKDVKTKKEKLKVEKPKIEKEEPILEENKNENNSQLEKLMQEMLLMKEEMVKKDAQNALFMQQLAINGIADNNKINKTSSDIMYSIKILTLNETELISPDGNVKIKLFPNEIVDVSQIDLRDLFKKSYNKVLFELGVCVFTENVEESCKTFRIKVKNDLSEDNIMNALENMNEMELNAFLDKLTLYKKDATVFHSIFYTIMGLDVDNKLSNLSRTTYGIVEKYFGCSFSQGTINLKTFRNLKK